MTTFADSGAIQLVEKLRAGISDGIVPAKIFNDPDIYELEVDRLFSRTWNFVAHESEIPEPGDYVVRTIADNSVLVARDEDRQIHVHLNLCRHRGNQMCKADLGNSSHFRCSYHGWVYKNSGELIAVPYHKQAFGDNLDKKQWGLVPVRSDSYEGLIFGSLNADAEPLIDFLGGFQFYLDYFLKTSDAGVEVYGPPDIWESNCDWKLYTENGSGDGYHTPVTHQFGFHLGYFASSGGTHSIGHSVHIPGKGHGIGLGETPGTVPFFAYPPEVVECLKRRLTPEQVKVFAPVRTAVGIAFPNLSFLSQPFSPIPGEPGVRFTTLRHVRPLSAGRMQMSSWCLVPKAAPADYKDEVYRAYTLAFGPGGMFEQDDMENWTNITRQLRGSVVRELDFPYVMGLGQSPIADFPGPGLAFKPYINDANFRNLWSTWAAYLSGEKERGK